MSVGSSTSCLRPGSLLLGTRTSSFCGTVDRVPRERRQAAPIAGAASAYALAADMIDPLELRWQRDPVAWATERAKFELWSKQREILESVRDNPNTAVRSCHSAGKSWISATATCWWLDVHPPGQARVITTAPTSKQVDAVLWYEINRMHRALGLRGQCNLRDWYFGRELVALGKKPPDHEDAAFQGFHAKYLLVIYDEAYGIPKKLWDEGSSLASNRYARQLAIGNPDGPGEFEERCRESSSWNVIHISYRDTPAITGEKISRSLAENLISQRWVDERRDEWGEESALFQSKCEGNFPSDGDPNAVVPHAWTARCRVLELPGDEPVEAGIDVGAGADRTVIRERRGLRAGREEIFVDADPMRSVGKLVARINDWGVTRVKVDVTGIGWALGGRLRELSSRHNPSSRDTTHHAEVVRVNFGEGPSPGNERRFLNRRAEIYWTVGRENSRLGLWDLTEVDDQTIHELTASRYEILDSFGKIKIEPKKVVIKRLKMSPDRAEALLLAFYDQVKRSRGVTDGLGALLTSGTLLGDISPQDSLVDANW